MMTKPYAIIMACVLSLTLASRSLAEEARIMWEYRTLKIAVSDLKLESKGNSSGVHVPSWTERTLNKLGANGWELVSTIRVPGDSSTGAQEYIIHYFKRRVKDYTPHPTK